MAIRGGGAGQAAELVPVSLSSAMASSRPHATAAAGNATQDAWSVPEIAAVSNLVNPVTIQQENVCFHVHLFIRTCRWQGVVHVCGRPCGLWYAADSAV